MSDPGPPYAELQVTSNFSFLRGASHPGELVIAAAELGHKAIAITDRNSLAGVVRAHQAAKDAEIRLVVGCRLDLEDASSLLCFPTDRAAYGRLTRLLTLGKRRAKKGECKLVYQDVVAHGAGQILVALSPEDLTSAGVRRAADRSHLNHPLSRQGNVIPMGVRKAVQTLPTLTLPRKGGGDAAVQPTPVTPSPLMGEGRGGGGTLGATRDAHSLYESRTFPAFLDRLAADFSGHAYLAAQHLYRGDDARRLAELADLAARARLPLVATNDVHAHSPERRPLQDVLTCIRAGCTVDEAGFRLFANAERHLKSGKEMARLFGNYPEAVARTLEIAERCRFSLDELRYEYPEEPTVDGRSPQAELAHRVAEGARRFFPAGVPDSVETQIRHELTLIAGKDYARYFLTVHDIVRFAEARGILCQGRGSAANSVVCYCLGITAVDPTQINLLFERFISMERNEPPDIDVDFEHERREEVIQFIYEKYGRDHAGLAATVIHYRSRAAIRDVGKALGLSGDVIGALAGTIWGWSNKGVDAAQVREAGLDPSDRRLRLALELSHELIGFPRHLSQHVGGFVITKRPLSEIVPIENAAMKDRTVIEWDKDDLDALDILKVDVLALGMLTCIRKGLDLIARHHGEHHTLATIPKERPEVYEMLSRADTVGVFQVESRAQMSMLPRLRPEKFYDIVIEVAIVRPGPIQGDMVHPYLRRRDEKEKEDYPTEALRAVLEKTLGVPLFQEQAMKIAMVAADFTAAEADQLRRAMATFRHNGDIPRFRERFVGGMVRNGYDAGFAARCFKQIEGFGTYGFPESHAASFAHLVYVSAWMKCFHPAVFAAVLLNSQPMGFYAPAQIVRDARDHGVEVRSVDVNHSDWNCTLEPGADEGMALRLGFRQIKGLAKGEADALICARGAGYADPETLWRRSGLSAPALETLAGADAFGSMGLGRRQALWAVKRLGEAPLPLFAAAESGTGGAGAEPQVALPSPTLGEEVIHDYASLRLSLKRHPLALLRARLSREGVMPSRSLPDQSANRRVAIAGLVLVRQQPGTASGVVFITLEDETGIANVIVWPRVFARFRRIAMGAGLIRVDGRMQREGAVIHVLADRLIDLSDRLWALLPRAPQPGDYGQAGPSLREGSPLRVRSRDFH